jgi:hypothetical protein
VGSGPGCASCGREDKAMFRTNPKGVPGIFMCRPCIDGTPRIGLGFERELLDAIEPKPEMGQLESSAPRKDGETNG